MSRTIQLRDDQADALAVRLDLLGDRGSALAQTGRLLGQSMTDATADVRGAVADLAGIERGLARSAAIVAAGLFALALAIIIGDRR